MDTYTEKEPQEMTRSKDIEQAFLSSMLLKFWGNMVENYNDDCRIDDFFEVANRCFDRRKSVDLIRTTYTKEELDSISNGVGSCPELDFNDTLGGVFYILWNSEGSRGKCRAVLDAPIYSCSPTSATIPASVGRVA